LLNPKDVVLLTPTGVLPPSRLLHPTNKLNNTGKASNVICFMADTPLNDRWYILLIIKKRASDYF
jgi:hypothetical protein